MSLSKIIQDLECYLLVRSPNLPLHLRKISITSAPTLLKHFPHSVLEFAGSTVA